LSSLLGADQACRGAMRAFASSVTVALAAFLFVSQADAATSRSHMEARKNPIRKVIKLIQDMKKEIEAEGDKEKELHEKFMCFCNSGTGDLTANIQKSKGEIEQLAGKLESEQAEKSQASQELVEHKQDRADAEKELKEARALHEKEMKENKALASEQKMNFDAVAGAIPALEKGLGGGASFVQLPQRQLSRVLNMLDKSSTVDDFDRKATFAFLQGQSSDASPGSGQIIGILKQMKDDMAKAIKETGDAGAASVESFGSLEVSKNEQVKLASESIESKTARVGELGVSIVQTRDTLEDTQSELDDSTRFAEQMQTQCATKVQEFDARVKARNEEITAVSEVIAILNNDDALETMQKVAPSTAALDQTDVSFLQRGSFRSGGASRAEALLRSAVARHPSTSLRLALFQLRSKLRSRRVGSSGGGGFDALVKQLEGMVAVLGKSQQDDDKQKDFCAAEIDKAGDEKSAVERKLKQIEDATSETNDAVEQLTADIAAFVAGIQELDKQVAIATEQRKEEHTDYVDNAAMNKAALALVRKAKKRMQKFYSPAKDQEEEGASLLQIRRSQARRFGLFSELGDTSSDEATSSDEVAPPQAPAGVPSGDVPKKSQQAGGVIGMMEMICRDLEMGMQEDQHNEKASQKDYVDLMKESQVTRKQDSQSITDKETQKAEKEDKIARLSTKNDLAQDALNEVKVTILNLHSSCDYLVENYDARKKARVEETDSLKNAIALLSGAQ